MSSGHWAGFKGDDEVYIISLLLPLTTLIFGAGCPGTSPDSRLHSCLRRASGRLPSLLHSTLQSGPTRSHGGDHAVPVVGRAAVTQPPAPSWCTPLISPHVRALTGQCSPSSHPMSGRLQVNAAHHLTPCRGAYRSMQPTINQTKTIKQGHCRRPGNLEIQRR